MCQVDVDTRSPNQWFGVTLEPNEYHKDAFKCPVCNMDAGFSTMWRRRKPDKYEQCLGIDKVIAAWSKCNRCKMIVHVGALSQNDAKRLYVDEYRTQPLRDTSVENRFKAIRDSGQDENQHRVKWISNHIRPKSLLDIGSGIGIFPLAMSFMLSSSKILCIEPNKESSKFISDKLGLECVNAFYDPLELDRSFDLVSLVHVLEHQWNAGEFIESVKPAMKQWLYIEVPDAMEIEYLTHDHDDFNSTHYTMWSEEHLCVFLKKHNLVVNDFTRYTTNRGTMRLMVLARRKVFAT